MDFFEILQQEILFIFGAAKVSGLQGRLWDVFQKAGHFYPSLCLLVHFISISLVFFLLEILKKIKNQQINKNPLHSHISLGQAPLIFLPVIILISLYISLSPWIKKFEGHCEKSKSLWHFVKKYNKLVSAILACFATPNTSLSHHWNYYGVPSNFYLWHFVILSAFLIFLRKFIVISVSVLCCFYISLGCSMFLWRDEQISIWSQPKNSFSHQILSPQRDQFGARYRGPCQNAI